MVFAEVMVLPNGMSKVRLLLDLTTISASKHALPIADISLKGCGVVEFSTREEAERAVKELNDTPLLGRQIFVREVCCACGPRRGDAFRVKCSHCQHCYGG